MSRFLAVAGSLFTVFLGVGAIIGWIASDSFHDTVSVAQVIAGVLFLAFFVACLPLSYYMWKNGWLDLRESASELVALVIVNVLTVVALATGPELSIRTAGTIGGLAALLGIPW